MQELVAQISKLHDHVMAGKALSKDDYATLFGLSTKLQHILARASFDQCASSRVNGHKQLERDHGIDATKSRRLVTVGRLLKNKETAAHADKLGADVDQIYRTYQNTKELGGERDRHKVLNFALATSKRPAAAPSVALKRTSELTDAPDRGAEPTRVFIGNPDPHGRLRVNADLNRNDAQKFLSLMNPRIRQLQRGNPMVNAGIAFMGLMDRAAGATTSSSKTQYRLDLVMTISELKGIVEKAPIMGMGVHEHDRDEILEKLRQAEESDISFSLCLMDPKGEYVKGLMQARFGSPEHKILYNFISGGCEFPGCNKPTWSCDIHHCEDHKDGGTMCVFNGCLLCPDHHDSQANREVNGTIIRGEDGIVRLIKPDGEVIKNHGRRNYYSGVNKFKREMRKRPPV
ncbi:MAG: HNH endonuclease signature motif containing protein [Corynebacterium sp.]|nr:HNH endonuclease signature motif containing protein [Corynebacterium sp.]